MMTAAAWGAFRPVALLYRTWSAAWSYPIRLHHTVAMIRGGQQPMVVSGCTVATCWHATPVLPVTVALAMRVCPLPDTVALSCTHVSLGARLC
jgi:hypothetical protein